jgi:anaerobic magnesium-protoporphyrin IX monomethyl ester cyclase
LKIILADSHGPVMGKDQTSANLSLLYLGSYLQSKMPGVELTYISQVHSGQHHLDVVGKLRPDFYAASFTSYSAPTTYELIREIKARHPSVVVVCGGPHVITHAKQVLEQSGADVCVIGEGEQTFTELVQNKSNLPGALESIPGVAFMKKGHYVKTAPRPLITDLDTIPFPNRDLVNDDDFCGLTYSKARPNTEMVVTRGCPLRCVFCANPVFRLSNGPLFRSRSPENIAREAEELYRRGYREIYIHSDELNVNHDWSVEVCKALAALGHQDLYFQCNLRVVPMSEELARWLRKANFWLVRVGIESANDRVLRGIKKCMSFEKTEKACQMLTDQGVKVFAFLMLFNFWEEGGELQHETPAEVRHTISQMYRLWWSRKLNYVSWAYACPVPGAEFYDIAVRHGLIDEDFFPGDTWNSFDHLKGVSKREFNSLYAKARRQQAVMAATSGYFEWRNWRSISRKAMTMFRGRPEHATA